MRALLFLLLAGPALAQPSPRPFALVEDHVVRLGDLFEEAGPRAGAALGPAPAPGTRQVVEAAQLAAIARRYGLDWRPTGGAERVVIERPGRALPREEVLLALRTALRPQGLEEEMELEPIGFTAPMVPEGAFVSLAVEGAVLDAAGQRFAATLAVLAEGQPTQRLRIAGRVVTTLPVVVAVRRMGAGEVLGEADVRLIRVPASRLRPGAAQEVSQVLGQALRRPAMPDQALLLAELAPRPLVQRGQTVVMVFEMPGITLTARGRAMEAAPRGATVPVMNLESRAVVEAEVIGPGRVRVGGNR
jgi:flagella basal body P-ring formation protein FlgA